MLTFSVTFGELTATATLPDDAGPELFSSIANRTVAAHANAFEVLRLAAHNTFDAS